MGEQKNYMNANLVKDALISRNVVQEHAKTEQSE